MTTIGEPARRTRRMNAAPAVALALLAPVIGEVLNGATRVSYIFALGPEIMVWGCGVVLIRELVQRWGGGWASIAALGAGLSIAVEFLVLQTSVAPLPWLEMASIPVYDRVWGVNWLWFAFMLGYEVVWVVMVPILVVNLLFPGRRSDPWLRRRGLVIATLTFAVGSTGLWLLWTRVVVPDTFQQPVYHPPAATLLLAALACALSVAAAHAVRRWPGDPVASGRAPSPWAVAAAAAAFGFPWWTLIALVFVPQPSLPLWLPLGSAVVWAAAAGLALGRWARARGWGERHRWALAFAAVMVSMLAGFLGSSLWPRIDLVGKIVMNAAAAAGMMALGRRIWRRGAAA